MGTATNKEIVVATASELVAGISGEIRGCIP